MAALTLQLPRCIFRDPATRTGTAAPRYVPLRTAVLSTMDVLLNQHDAPFTIAAVPALVDITAAIKFPDAETRLAACSVIATVLHPPRIAAARRSPEWPRVREELYLSLVRAGKPEEEKDDNASPTKAAAAAAAVAAGEDVQRREQRVGKALESVCLSVLVKLQAVPAARTRIPYRLFGIICNSEELQRLVADSDALENLISFIILEVWRAPLAQTAWFSATALGWFHLPVVHTPWRWLCGMLRLRSVQGHIGGCRPLLPLCSHATDVPACMRCCADGKCMLGKQREGGGGRGAVRNGAACYYCCQAGGHMRGAALRLAATAAAVRAAVCRAAVRHGAGVPAGAVGARFAVPADGARRDCRRAVRPQLRRSRDDAQPAGVCQVPAAPSTDRPHSCRDGAPLVATPSVIPSGHPS